MKSVADRFNVSISTFDNHFKRMVTVICDSLLKRLIKWPSEAEKPVVINAFQVKKNFAGVLGSIDGCHIKIGKPTERANDYYNRKGFYSVVLQAVCREDRRFTDIYCGWPGKVHDARVFRNSPLSERLQVLCGCNHLLGDGAYPLSGNLLTPYRDNGHLNRAQKNYNTCLSSTRVLIENAFGTIKNRFRRLKCIELKDITYIVKTIVSACIIHNLCILNQDEMPDEEDDQENCDDGNVNLDVNANAQGIMKRQIITQNLALQNN